MIDNINRLVDLDTDATVTITLTTTQLTDLRIACLHRLDALKRTMNAGGGPSDLNEVYARTKAMMDEGGILQLALHRFIRQRRGV